MAHYMVQASYTSEAVSNLVKNPQDRAAAVRPIAERLGGKLESIYFTFGDYDLVVIGEFPDNVTMAAISMALTASGVFKTFKTTILIPMDEAVEAMKKASAIGYQPPRAS